MLDKSGTTSTESFGLSVNGRRDATSLTGPVRRNGAGGHRASLTGSKLIRPKTEIYRLAANFQRYVHLPDPMPLYVTMGALAANMLTGYPLWLMLIGNSGSGKSLMIKSTRTVPG